MERLYGLLGWPVGHSVSPAMMEAAFRTCDVKGRYLPFAVPADKVDTALRGLAALGAGGVNVTIPHKRTVYSLVDDLTDEAASAGAVNTVRFESDGRIIGHNTDIVGWWRGIEPYFPHGVQTACILGSGGAARAALAALSRYAPGCSVAVCARNRDQREALAAAASDLDCRPVDWADRHEVIASAELISNATSIGMWPDAADCPVADRSCFHAAQVVQDMVYRPRQTEFLNAATEQGAKTVDGLLMLVGQGVAAFEFWTGEQAPVEVMTRAAEGALAERV